MILLAHHELWLAKALSAVEGSPRVTERQSPPMTCRTVRHPRKSVSLGIVGVVIVATAFFAASAADAAPGKTHAIQKAAAEVIRSAKPPRVPEGFPSCEVGMRLNRDLPRTLGETIRYVVDVDGVSLGQIDFRVERAGRVDGQSVTEYRSRFALDSMISTVVPVSGQAASLVPTNNAAPIKSMNRYTMRKTRFEEEVSFTGGGTSAMSLRQRNGKSKEVRRTFAEPVRDFISGFYMMRALPREARGCTIIYANQRAYTIWFEYDGTDSVKTPVGLKTADLYRVRYANERSSKALNGKIWLSRDSSRLPYRMMLDGKHTMDAKIQAYKIKRP